jgi:predicted metalloprotease
MRRRTAALLLAGGLLAGACGGDPLIGLPTSEVPSPPTTSGGGITGTTAPPPTSSPPETTSSTTATTSATTSTTTTTTTTTAPPAPLTLEEVIAATVSDLESYWQEAVPAAYGVAYRPVTTTIPYYPSTGNLPVCGDEQLTAQIAADNAFYCRPDDYVAWDAEGLLPDLYTEFGDFGVALVLAHEWGHVVQQRASVRGATIMTELQADCFAGTWTAAVVEGSRPPLRLEPGDLEQAMAGYLLFRDPPGTSVADPAAHGSAFDRVNAFQDGFFAGVGECVPYEEGEFAVVDIPLTVDDLQTGGDLPYDDVPALIIPALEAYWEETYPTLFGTEWDPVDAFGPYFPSSGDLPECEAAGSDDPGDSAFYCPDGDYVAWDGERLFPDLYQSIGDFALGMVLAHEWSTAAQWRAGLPIEGAAAELQADCLAGAWSAALAFPGNPFGVGLSAGDLDEGVAGFLAVSEESSGTAFERFDAFEDGFFNGPEACLEAGS